MAFEPEMMVVDTKYRKMLGNVKTQSSVLVSANDGIKIEKVLSVSAVPCVDNVTVNQKNATFEGKIFAKAIVKTAENEYMTLFATSTFSNVFNSDLITPDTKVYSCAKTYSIENMIASENSINFVCVVDLNINAILNQQIKYVKNVDTAIQKKMDIDFSTISATMFGGFEIEQEIETPSSISKIVSLDCSAVMDKITAGDDMAFVSGQIFATMIYLTNDENPKLKTQNYRTEFNEEVLLSGAKTGDRIGGCLQICSTEFDVQGELSSSKAVINLKNGFKINLYAERDEISEAVVDVYCPKYELNLSHQSFLKQKIVCKKQVVDKIDGNVVLSENSQRIDRVVGTTSAFAVVKNVKKIENAVLVSGTVFCNVIYFLDDEGNTINSIQVELPYETIIECEKVNDTSVVSCFVCVKEIEARNKKAKEIDVLADLVFSIIVFDENNMVALSNVELSEKRKQFPNALGLYVIEKAEDVFDVGKQLLVSPEKILEQNADLTFPITDATQILVYRQK